MKNKIIFRMILWGSLLTFLVIVFVSTLFSPSSRAIQNDWDDTDKIAPTVVSSQEEIVPIYYANKDTVVHQRASESSPAVRSCPSGEFMTIIGTSSNEGKAWAVVEDGYIYLGDLSELQPDAIMPALVTASPAFGFFTPSEESNFKTQYTEGTVLGITSLKKVNTALWGYVSSDQCWVPMEYLTINSPAPANVPGPTVPADTPVPTESPTTRETTPSEAAPGTFPSTITGLEVEWALGDIVIRSADVEQVTVSAQDLSLVRTKLTKENALSIQLPSKKDWIALNGLDKMDLTITLPKTTLLDQLEVEFAAGNLTIENLAGTIGKMELEGVSGSCGVTGCSVGKLDVDTASGDVHFQGRLEALEMDAASASFIGVLENTPKRVEMESVSGQLSLTLPEDCGFTITSESLNTRFSSDYPAKKIDHAHVYGDGSCKIHLEGVSGIVEIRKP